MMEIRTVLCAKGVVLDANQTDQSSWLQTAASAPLESSARPLKSGLLLIAPSQRTHGQLGFVSSAHQEGTQGRGQHIAMCVPLEPLRTLRRLCATRAQKVQLDFD